MRENYFGKVKSKGETSMKKSILILALVAAFVLAFGSAASATYRGFTPVRTQAEVEAGMLQGFITFGEARAEMARNFSAVGAFGSSDPGAGLQNTAHGGYVTTTTKCAVCHSAHRASGINPNAVEGTASGSTGGNNLSNVQNQLFLTAGSATCEACHTASSGHVSRLLVEWGGNGGGPHAAPRRGCVFCHQSGIHGMASSSFNVMNVFMLGNSRGGTDGGPSPTGIETRDQQIRREIVEGRVLRGQTLDVPATSSFPTGTNVVANPTAGSTWWYNGVQSLGPAGTIPTGFPGAPNGNQYAAARSLATAYTCGEQGCHVSSAMFNLNWGMGFERADRVRNVETDAGATGALRSEGTTLVTGHIMPSIRVYTNADTSCGPCHAGSPAGFPTASTIAGAADVSRRAYGCDQCHDMVGVATNTTAWPHGNRDILVYEWLADGTQIETTAAAGNLWMYGGSIARANVPGMSTTNNPGNPALQPSGTINLGNGMFGTGGSTFNGPTSANESFADQSWTVLTGVTSGRYGVPNNTEGSFHDNPAYADYAPAGATGLTDGSCLKCHVALDSASLAAGGSMGADAIRHAWRAGGTALEPSWNGAAVSGSNRLFLYR